MTLDDAHLPTPDLRVVIAHDFLETYGGAERIIAEVADLFPDAPFWAILGRRSVARRMGIADRVHFLLPEREPLLRHYRWLAPLFPALVRACRLPPADVLVTSSYAFAHGFRTRNDAPQLCYSYSPLRFAWSMTDDYRARMPGGRPGRVLFDWLAAFMRPIDRRAARSVTRYVTESDYTARQIERFYGRSAEVVGAPVNTELFRPNGTGHDEFFLFCGRLVEPYKRPSLVVDAFRGLPHRLLIAGDGPAMSELRARAGPNVGFLGHLDDSELIPLMQRCAAAVFPSCDDFGLTPLEVMSCGRPVLAHAEGGALQTVVPGVTGELFDASSVDALVTAVRGLDPSAYDPAAIRRHAQAWNRWAFRNRIVDAVERTASEGGIRSARR